MEVPLESVPNFSEGRDSATIEALEEALALFRRLGNMRGVANAQRLTVTLHGISDTAGNFTATLAARMGVLVGDTTGNRIVNSSDISQTQSQSGQPVDATNFREDVTANGQINSSDIAMVQSQSGTGLPLPPQTSGAPPQPRQSRSSPDRARSED